MTLRQFFDEYPWINISAVARECEINEYVFMAYVRGDKRPSKKRIKEIEDTIRGLMVEPPNFELTIE